MLVNSFVVTTTEFLNKFSSLCEAKLAAVGAQMQRVEIVLALLEAKLDSIQWMGGGGGGAAAAAPAAASAPAAATDGSIPSAPPLDSTAAASSTAAAPAAAPAAPSAPAEPQVRLKDDPRYSKYFKMLAMGVPKPAVKMKMSADGVDDPEVIERDPDGPAPPGAPPSQALVAIDTAQSDSDASENMSDDE